MLMQLLIGGGIVAAGFLIFVATRPSEFHIERSLTTSASPATVFAQIDDFRAWSAWSPWEKLDPKMERAHSGAAAGVGAVYAWRSDDGKVGQGRMTILESNAPTRVGIKLEFIKPFAATNTVTFTIAPAAGGSQVTWAMDGRRGFTMKLFGLLMNMDRMVGGDFESGLASLKGLAESAPAPAVGAGAAAPG
jgi:hypothetical protein